MNAADTLGLALLQRARNAIAGALARPTVEEAEHEALPLPGASFVTLTLDAQLRGCIGTLQAWRPLQDDVRANARAAAFRDPRFAPLSHEEYERVRVEVSVLAQPEPLPALDESHALSQLRPFEDGVVLALGELRATFLPQVWEQLPEPAEFMRHLKRKAGLPADYWSAQITLSRYSVSKWKEEKR